MKQVRARYRRPSSSLALTLSSHTPALVRALVLLGKPTHAVSQRRAASKAIQAHTVTAPRTTQAIANRTLVGETSHVLSAVHRHSHTLTHTLSHTHTLSLFPPPMEPGFGSLFCFVFLFLFPFECLFKTKASQTPKPARKPPQPCKAHSRAHMPPHATVLGRGAACEAGLVCGAHDISVLRDSKAKLLGTLGGGNHRVHHSIAQPPTLQRVHTGNGGTVGGAHLFAAAETRVRGV